MQAKMELWLRFKYNFQLVLFTRSVLIDDELYSSLNEDAEATIGPGQRYRLQVGEFPDWEIQSPTGFLLDRFMAMHERDDSETEAESLWQLLVLI